MSKVLYVAWRSSEKDAPQWGPVGRLDNELGHYRFVYTKGARCLKDFAPFPGMTDVEQVYESDDLLPVFQNRMLSPSRPEYRDFLKWSGFDPEYPPNPLDLLGITEGLRATDKLELFPCPQPDANNQYSIRFFLHGIRYMPDAAREEIKAIESGESLGFMFDVSNWVDQFAVAIRTCPPRDRVLLGYLPRYLSRDVKVLFDNVQARDIRLEAVRVNPDAPMQQRLLCLMRAPWPESFSPCEGEEFQPIVEELACSS